MFNYKNNNLKFGILNFMKILFEKIIDDLNIEDQMKQFNKCIKLSELINFVVKLGEYINNVSSVNIKSEILNMLKIIEVIKMKLNKENKEDKYIDNKDINNIE